jgi:hypothetical protein
MKKFGKNMGRAATLDVNGHTSKNNYFPIREPMQVDADGPLHLIYIRWLEIPQA